MFGTRLTVILVVVLGVVGAVEGGVVLHVDGDSPADGPGNDWAHAYHYLQDALSVAAAGDEIRVAEGVHRPDESTASPSGTGDRGATFELIDGVTIAGGYAGYGAADPEMRGFESVLSGNIGDEGDDSDNSRHIVTGYLLNATTVLDGFTITAANAGGDRGGGMRNYTASPTLIDCHFIGNSALIGGGVFNDMDSDPRLTNCTFSGNTAGYGGGMYNDYCCDPTLIDCAFVENMAGEGGGMQNQILCNPKLMRCVFTGNTAVDSGGGMQNSHASHPTLSDCIFTGNTCGCLWGGGIYNFWSDLTLSNCVFSGNAAIEGFGGAMSNCHESYLSVTDCVFVGNSAVQGGAMENYEDAFLCVTNCIFSGNTAEQGGALAIYDGSVPRVTNCSFSGNSAEQGGAIFSDEHSGGLLVNCVLWGDVPDEIDGGPVGSVVYSCVEGGAVGGGNIDDNPRFMDVDGADDVLGTPDDNLRLRDRSPCIDAGLSIAVETDLDGNRRIVDDASSYNIGVGFPDVIDMGAYEYNSSPPEPLWPDLDGDCDVDISDLAELLAHYGETCGTR